MNMLGGMWRLDLLTILRSRFAPTHRCKTTFGRNRVKWKTRKWKNKSMRRHAQSQFSVVKPSLWSSQFRESKRIFV